MIETIIFLVGSGGIVWISRPSLLQRGSHGYYRFFAWEILLGLFLINARTWFVSPLAWYQILSWLLLIVCLVPLVEGIRLLRKVGRPKDQLEATTQLVKSGIYHLIRHPLYASLLFLGWGIFFKSPSVLDGSLALVASAFLYATARADERECLLKFGPEYAVYMRSTKMFVPFLF